MLHFPRWTLAVLAFLLVQTAPLAAQDAAPTPLDVNTAVTGLLREGGASMTYTFVVPTDQDVVVALSSDKTVLEGYCLRESSVCSPGGGGGGDSPTALSTLIPANGTEQTVDLTVTRPLDGDASFRLAAYALAAQALPFGDIVPVQPLAGHPYRVYALQSDPALPFTVEAEDAADSGAFLWAAYQPYTPNAVKLSDKRLPMPEYVDGALRGNSGAGVRNAALYYLGGNQFRLLVASNTRYTLHAAALQLQPLEAGQKLPVTVSYREPLRVLRLNTAADSSARITARVTAGTGALLMTYTRDLPYGDGLALGADGRAGVPFPLSGTINNASGGDGGLLVVVQIPFEFSRGQVTVEISWRPE